MMTDEEMKKACHEVNSEIDKKFAEMGLTATEVDVAKLLTQDAFVSGSRIVAGLRALDSNFRVELVWKAAIYALLYSMEESSKPPKERGMTK